MKIKLNSEAKTAIANGQTLVGSSDGFWFDLTKGGYFDPSDVMADPVQVTKMREAIKLVQELEEVYNQIAHEF